MRFLILCEGDAETWDSWSGSSRSLVDHLRAAGHSVVCGDVDLYGGSRLFALARSFHPVRNRWWWRYHLGAAAFSARSRKAEAIVRRVAGAVDVVVQIGATFEVHPPPGVAHVLYCDANLALTLEGARLGFAAALDLSPREIEEVGAREARVYRGADKVYTMSHRLRGTFLSEYGLAEDRVETVHAGPNFPIGEAPPVPPSETRGKEPVILFIGRQFHRKGGPLLMEAFAAVRRQVPDAKLLVVGLDTLPEEFQPPPEGVEILGFLDKSTAEGRSAIFDAYERARVFCLPTQFEPFGVVYLEAMHYELPCVGPDAWAVPELIEDGRTGRLYAPARPEALAEVLVDLLTDRDRSIEMGLAGKRRLHDHFTWPLVVERMTASIEVLREG